MARIGPEDLLRELDHAVRAAIGADREATIAYSGGLDSSIVAALGSRHSLVKCYTCALPDSHDARNAKEMAAKDGLELKVVTLNTGDVRGLVCRASKLLDSGDPVRIAYTIPLMSVIDESSVPLVLAGNGADELFGGYARYLTSEDAREEMAKDLSKAVLEANAIENYAQRSGKRFACPFLDEGLPDFCAEIELERLVRDGRRKLILREVASVLSLHTSEMPKKAAQYSSGIMKEMKRQARVSELSLSNWMTSVLSGSKESN